MSHTDFSAQSDEDHTDRSGVPERVVFVHIPKTGGTSFHELLKTIFANEEIHPERLNNFSEYDPDTFGKFRLFSAHMDARTLPLIPDPKYTITILREPRARILSLYYFWKSHTWETIEKNNLHGPRIAKSMDLLSFLTKRDEAIPINIENVQARAVWGHLFLFKDGEDVIADSQTLELIKAAVDRFDLVGTMENLPSAVNALCEDFGIDALPELPRLQVGDVSSSPQLSREAVEKEPITDEISEQLDRLTVYDRPLYEYVVRSRQKPNLLKSIANSDA